MRLFVAALAFSLALAACDAQGEMNPPLPEIELSVGPAKIRLEIARSSEEQRLGLMNRARLDEGRGMIFIFNDERVAQFWMKNTSIPLSIAFVSKSGIIQSIKDMEPFDLSTTQADGNRYSKYAIEAPKGWFARAGVREGDSIDVAALLARIAELEKSR
jgi:hypothetical protein